VNPQEDAAGADVKVGDTDGMVWPGWDDVQPAKRIARKVRHTMDRIGEGFI
jgi:hypothetical protein